MHKNCLNHKFLILMILPITCGILSICFLFFAHRLVLSLIILAVSLIYFSLLICFEPIAYSINKSEIKVICVFKQYSFSYTEIELINLHFDVFFEFLFIKDYVLIVKNPAKIPNRCIRIVKNSKTKNLIEKYYKEKII